MARIGEKTLAQAAGLCGSLLREYENEIDQAFKKAEGDSLSVSMTLKFSPAAEGSIRVDAGISFVAEKIKDTTFTFVDEEQLAMFVDPAKKG
ncbi:MAG: hypothetical protein JRJ69_16660 [Deltaproteobacteria bacterium]|nr:hypothetical protein [Deltaproteobacteria bacterium]